MLELPESRTIANQLNETIVGKTIEYSITAQSPHGFAWYSATPEEYDKTLKWRTVEATKSIAGFVQIELDGGWRLAFQDGVNIRYLENDSKLPAKHQLLICFSDGSCLVCTVQMYGGMILFQEGTYDNKYYLVAQEKISPLTEEFNYKYFTSIWDAEKPTLSAKALLATEQRIPGLGNGVLQDILWNAKINPQTKLGNLSEEDRKRLYESLKSTLKAMERDGGRDTEKTLFGNPGGYPSVLSSKTVAYPCPRCGGGITRKAYLGGNVYFCEHCQPILK